ncbi:MAG: lysophospholipid acyltransferase family protein [Planctomycetota bacterium]|nr:lysophospholipid acyltransferase family protein [Planctomycetota bacterium]
MSAVPGPSLAPIDTRPRIQSLAAHFWVWLLMATSQRAPWVVRFTRPFFVHCAWLFAPTLRDDKLVNARRLLGPQSTPAQQRLHYKRVVGHFYSSLFDIARSGRMSLGEIRGRVERVEGIEHYRSARAVGRGAILVTAHLGAFEVAVAALRENEPKRVHVLYHTDRLPQFQRLRSELHEKLGVVDARLERGWEAWLDLRDALGRDEVVLMQGDRIMPGHKGVAMPFCGGLMDLPTGPVRLAQLTGAPIIPVFAPRSPSGKVLITIGEPIWVGGSGRSPDHAQAELAAAIEACVRQYPDQWLVLYRAWREEPSSP